jgi:methionyl-tRNA formyltransferase
MHDAESIGVTLQQLTDELDAGGIIQIDEFEINCRDTYQDILRTAYLGSVDMLAEAVIAIQNDEFEPTEPDSLGDLYTAPGWLYAAKYLLKNTMKRRT